MSKLMEWTEILKGKGVKVIDNTGTLKDNGVKQVKVMPAPTENNSVVLPSQTEVDAAMDR